MAENEKLNQPNQPNQQNPNEERAVGAAAGAPNQTDAQNLKAQSGGLQEDQITGQTSEGAFNQSRENRNPSGNKPERNQGDSEL